MNVLDRAAPRAAAVGGAVASGALVIVPAAADALGRTSGGNGSGRRSVVDAAQLAIAVSATSTDKSSDRVGEECCPK